MYETSDEIILNLQVNDSTAIMTNSDGTITFAFSSKKWCYNDNQPLFYIIDENV